MPWLKSDDRMPENDKIWALSDACYRLYEGGRFYAARKLTDGHVPTDRVSALTPKPATKPQIEALVRARLWHRLPDVTCKSCISWRQRKGAGALPRSGYLVHDFLEFNPSRAQWTRDEAQRKEAGRIGGLEKARRRSEPLSEMPSEPLSDALSEPLADSPRGAPSGPLSEMPSEMPSGAPSPYPGTRSPRPGSIDPVPAEDPFEPDTQEDADLSIRRGRREGVRHVRGAAEAVVAAARRRSGS